MAFKFGSPGGPTFGSTSGSSATAEIQTGETLESIETEVRQPDTFPIFSMLILRKALGFQAISGEAKIRLLPSPWPADALPPSTASLLSIASKKGLVAAAGPDSVVIASTDSVRGAFTAGESTGSNIKAFTPQLTLNLGMRISHVTFSADESYLVLSAENGGGLAVYEVQGILQGNTKSTFELPTNGISLRSLLPNPTPEKAELIAAITANGELMMANLTTRQFLNGSQGLSMKDGVSCASWSARGKQLVVGLANGACYQLTPEGSGKADIPRPPKIEGEQHVSAISWLENDLFLIAHTPSVGFDGGPAPVTTFHIVTRQAQPQLSFIFQAIQDPCFAFETNRSPPCQFLQRLRNFPPNLTDLIVVSSTASVDVGLFTRADVALTNEHEAAKITKVFTSTSIAEDSRRAQLPMSDNLQDTSPIGVALDLSATEKVLRPLPAEEIDESAGPLPALMILNNEGVLASWWIVYSESIRQRTTFPGLTAVSDSQTPAQAPPTKSAAPFTNSSPQQANSSFGQTALNMSGPNSLFGTSSVGPTQSSWASGASANAISQNNAPAFGKPAFGSSIPLGASAGGSSFGSTGNLGSRQSPWGAPPSGPTTLGTTFGQTASLGAGTGSPFGNNSGSNAFGSRFQNTTSSTLSSVGFASFAKGPGFAAAAAQIGGESPFSKASQGTAFGEVGAGSISGGNQEKVENVSPNAFGGSGFTLGSIFKGDGTASTTDAPKPIVDNTNSLFGGDFAKSLGDVPAQNTSPAPEIKEADMDDGTSEQDTDGETSPIDQASSTPAGEKPPSQFPDSNPPIHGGLFGTQAQSSKTPAAVGSSVPATLPAAPPKPISITPDSTPKKGEEPPRSLIETPSAHIKTEPQDDSPPGVDEDYPAAPLPPHTTSKDSYSPGDTSQSSSSGSKYTPNDAPLPPDFLPSKVTLKPRQSDFQAPLPADDEDSGLDDEGSGVDVGQEISPTTDPTQTPKITPGSSFGAPIDKVPTGLFSSKAEARVPPRTNTLFGELGNSSIPFLPPPSKLQQSPRSPSPIRLHQAADSLRPDNARSISAPNASSKALANRKAELSQSTRQTEIRPSIEETRKLERERQEVQRLREQEEETQPLSDEDDEKIREELTTEVQATLDLEPFLAHQDYTEKVNKPGLPGQIEKVFRDINSMIDTIGINARSLEAFVKGHTEMRKDRARLIGDLDAADWCLGEIDDLSMIGTQIEKQVEGSRITDLAAKVAECHSMSLDLQKLRVVKRNLAQSLVGNRDLQRDEVIHASLCTEDHLKQNDLRKQFTHTQKLIAKVEDDVTVLRADLVSKDSISKDYPTKKPTVEAVMNTIMKMTSMIEKRSGDIDILETDMHKLGFSSINGSQDGSSFVVSTPGAASQQTDSLNHSMNSLRLSVSQNGTPKKRMGVSGISMQEVSRYQTKMRQRKAMNAVVKEALIRSGPIIRPLD